MFWQLSKAGNITLRIININHLQYAEDKQSYIALCNDAGRIPAVNASMNSTGGTSSTPYKWTRQIWGNLDGMKARLWHEMRHTWNKLVNVSFQLAKSTKSFGMTIDNKLTLTDHVNNVYEAAHPIGEIICYSFSRI